MPSPALTALAVAVLQVEPAPERVLQLECGEGEGVFFLSREFPAARVRGLDRDPDLVRAATARVGLDPEGRVAFKASRKRSLPYPDDHFDLVVQLVGHPPPAETARVLRPGGILILAGPPAGAGRFQERLLRRRLRRHAVELGERVEAAEDAFVIGRLSVGGSRSRAE